MYCVFCGKEIRDGAVFCPECGKNQETGNVKTESAIKKVGGLNKKTVISVIAALLVIVLIGVIIKANQSASIVGVWMNGTDKITFTSDGDFKWDSDYGTYTITDAKTLVLEYGYYSYNSGSEKYQYSSQAKTDSDYWYIENGKLYIFGCEYSKK